ncbi:MAG: adenylyltransferase/cytidyltransferase family protein [Synergistaceae bacterium]|nr:adenylyltransferase/cytidyltransferase family protein [Synergistaceae bacterium]
MFDFGSRVVKDLSESEKRDVASLIDSCGLSFEEGAERTVLVEDSDGGLAATASLFGNVIRMVAVSSDHQEAGLSAVAISCLLTVARAGGQSHLFVFTKPEMAGRFASLGFRNIAETPGVSLLEIGEPGAAAYRKYLAGFRAALGNDASRRGAVVVNCNPFTLGHRFLIERALERCDVLYVIVVEADMSIFSFEDRFAMVKSGTANLNVAGAADRLAVIGSGEYAVSSATFPTYFLKERAPLLVAEQQARLDVNLFLRLFVPSLGVKARFVGTEPLSELTAVYNRTMREALPPGGVEVVEVERAVTPKGDVISASEARAKLSSGEVNDIGDYLPDSTIKYLREKLSYSL